MTDDDPGRAGELRRAFDRGFAEAPAAVAADVEAFLGVRAGGEAYAIRLAEVSGLFADRTIVRLPSVVAAFLGLTGVRREVVPVYSLQALLGHPPETEPPRWIVVTRGHRAVALAFDQFDGYLAVQPDDVVPAGDTLPRIHIHGAVRIAETLRGIVSAASVVDSLRGPVDPAATT